MNNHIPNPETYRLIRYWNSTECRWVYEEEQGGLRDQFAMAALQGIMHFRERTGSEFGYETPSDVARRCYDMAEAMMEERAKR